MEMSQPIYLDYNATTPVSPTVLEQMLPWMTRQPWNASSTHVGGRAAHAAVETAREQVASMIGTKPREIVWTSGATESNNLALKGTMQLASPGTRLLVSTTEHKAVLDPADALKRYGYTVETIPVERDGIVDLAALEDRLAPDVGLVSVMLANNETGVVQPIKQIAGLVHEHGAVLHTDATQAPGKIPVDFHDLGVDLASLSAHKFYGPKGVGALFVRRGIEVEPLLHGGGHEAGLRSGTSNVPGIVGMGAAAEEIGPQLAGLVQQYESLTTQLVDEVTKIGETEIIGRDAPRLPNTVSIRIRGADADAVMVNCPTVMMSSGSACTARVPDASHVLQAMGLTRDEAYECIRLSVGRSTTSGDIDVAATSIRSAISRVRSFAQEVMA